MPNKYEMPDELKEELEDLLYGVKNFDDRQIRMLLVSFFARWGEELGIIEVS